MITPEKAKELWEGIMLNDNENRPLYRLDDEYSYVEGVGAVPTGIKMRMEPAWDRLFAAAPELTQQIAGMHWEYAAQVEMGTGWTMVMNTERETWTTNPTGSLEWIARTNRVAPNLPTRLVRRLVTNPEVVEP